MCPAVKALHPSVSSTGDLFNNERKNHRLIIALVKALYFNTTREQERLPKFFLRRTPC